MASYEITGTTSPDCTTSDTGEPVGTFLGYDYWSWVNGSTTWYLFRMTVTGPDYWTIGLGLSGPQVRWLISSPEGSADPTGIYTPVLGVVGNPIVSENEESSGSSASSSASSLSSSISSGVIELPRSCIVGKPT